VLLARLFGTDGVRGRANIELSPELALALGTAAAHVIVERKKDARIIIGRDPRISGDILEAAMVAGVCSQGLDAVLVGIISSPGVAYLTRTTGAAAGAVISASHNPVGDNGIKFFGPDGFKLDDAVESAIEDYVPEYHKLPRPSGADVGRMHRRHELAWEYAHHVKEAATCRLDGLKLVLDCANGAASELAPQVFSELGADVTVMSADPDGININAGCGSLHPQDLAKKVLELGAHAGLAFDGDADRVILVDERGEVVDGDHVMAICGLALSRKGNLSGNVVVGTVMSNMGLEVALARGGVRLVRTPVGDRYVCDEMRRLGADIGGEKSGHIILSRYTTTGDGMMTGLAVLSIMQETGTPLSQLAGEMEEFPQLLVNIPVRVRDGWEEVSAITQAISKAEERLGSQGRVVVRPSGTEKLIRVMAEGPNETEVADVVEHIACAVRSSIGFDGKGGA
jgi:phosphoglucosamine mutase